MYKRQGKDSVDLIRDSLFSIQVQQPWLLLQFGNSNAEEIGTDRVEALVSTSPEDEDGKTREEVVKTEIEDNDNNNLTIPQVVNRLGMVFFLLFFNLGITIFVFLLTGMMLFSQILFIIFAMFLPISFLLSMIPVSYTHLDVYKRQHTHKAVSLMIDCFFLTKISDWSDEMSDIFKDMQAKVGCDYISDLPSYKRKVWHEMKRLNPADYEERQLEDFSKYVFGMSYQTLKDVRKQQKGREEQCRKQGCWWKRKEQLAKKQYHTGLTCR